MNAYFDAIIENKKVVGGVSLFDYWATTNSKKITIPLHAYSIWDGAYIDISKEWQVYKELLNVICLNNIKNLIFHTNFPHQMQYLTNNLIAYVKMDYKKCGTVIVSEKPFLGAKEIHRGCSNDVLYVNTTNIDYEYLKGCFGMMKGNFKIPKLFKDLRTECRNKLYAP